VELDRSRAGRRNLLLASLPAKDFALLAPHLKDFKLEQGAVLQEQGERIEQVYFPRDGIVSLLAVMHQGEAIETATIGFEGAVGTFAGFGSRRAHTRAVVQVRGSASRIAASRFRKIAQENEAVCRIVVRYGEMLLIQVQQTAACNALHPVEARLSRWLLQARDRLESNKINLTHEFLSQMLGVRRTTVTVVANMLQQAGLIRYHRGQIEIVDWEGLKARSCECYEAIRRNVEEVTPATAR
jgi:CRP-like cAMP-binding protein